MSRRVAVADDVDAIPMINPSDGAYAFQDRWGDGSEARHRGAAQRSKCVFCVAPFAALSLAALATGVTYGAMAMSANDKTDFTCDLVRIAPAASVGGCAGLFVLLLVVLFLLRSCWAHAASCSKGRVCAFVGITLLVVLALVAGFGASVISQLVRFFAQQQPSLDGTITINAAQYGGLPSAPVSIVRDSNGLTHIEGATRNDVIFGQGFAQATDRLWQLEFFRLVGKGELSRHVGDAGLSIDKQTRTLGVARAAETMCSAASADTMSALASFAAGVNLFLTTSSARPVEFYFMSESWWPLSRHEPDLFTAQDGCYSAKLLQLNLADNLKMEIDRFRMWWLQGSSASGATYAEINTLYFNQTNITGTILSDSDLGITDADAVARRAWDAQSFAMEAQLYASVFAPMRAASEAAGTLNNKGDGGDGPNDDAASASGTNKRRPNKYDMVRGLIRKHASNAWAASAGGAASPCGASDPHLDINLPSVWYYNHLAIRPTPGAAPTWESAGVSMTGIPGVHIGKTSSVSWGITMAISDIQDLFVIIPDPARPSTHYMYKNVSTPFTVRTETITYKDGFFGGTKTLTLNILETVYGPNIVPVTELPSDLIISLQSVVMQSDSTSADAVLGFMNPNLKTVNGLCSMVFRRLRSPAFSVPSADASGNLGYCISGAYQVRQQGHTGMWPTLGDGSMDPPSTTQPDVPDSALPHKFVTAAQINSMPVGGTSISAANQKIYPDGYPIALGYDYIPPFRGARIQDLLAVSRAANTLSNVATHTTVQSDVQSNIWVKHLKSWFANLDNATVQFCLPQRAQPVWQQLLAWDGRVNVGDTLPSALWGWLRLMNEVTAPVTDSVKLTPWSEYMFVPSILNMDPTQRSNVAIYFSEALCMKALRVMNDVNPYCSDYFFHQQCWLLGIVQFGVMVDQGYPSKVWGTDLSQLHAVNLMMDGSPLECMFNRQLPKDGDVTSVDVSEFVLNDNPTIYAHAASSMRQIYDWNAPQTVQFSFPGGASGYPYSPYYFNLAPIFQKDQWVPVVVMNGTAGVTSPAHSQTLHP